MKCSRSAEVKATFHWPPMSFSWPTSMRCPADRSMFCLHAGQHLPWKCLWCPEAGQEFGAAWAWKESKRFCHETGWKDDRELRHSPAWKELLEVDPAVATDIISGPAGKKNSSGHHKYKNARIFSEIGSSFTATVLTQYFWGAKME